MHTYGMISGMIVSGVSLGSIVGPVIGGAITDALDFTWLGTILAGLNFLMVSYLLFYKYRIQNINEFYCF